MSGKIPYPVANKITIIVTYFLPVGFYPKSDPTFSSVVFLDL